MAGPASKACDLPPKGAVETMPHASGGTQVGYRSTRTPFLAVCISRLLTLLQDQRTHAHPTDPACARHAHTMTYTVDRSARLAPVPSTAVPLRQRGQSVTLAGWLAEPTSSEPYSAIGSFSCHPNAGPVFSSRGPCVGT